MQPPPDISRRRLPLFLLYACVVLAVSNADESRAQPEVLVLPVETDLQRELVPNKADIYVLLDADSFTPADLGKLKETLSPHKIPGIHVHLSIYSVDAPQEARSLVRYALLGFMYDSGFQHFSASTGFRLEDSIWNALTKRLDLENDAPTEPEPATVKENVKAYPVLNPLSRLLAHDADYVLILPSVHLEDGAIPETIVKASKAAIESVQLREEKSITFVLPYIAGDDRNLVVDRLQKLGKLLRSRSSKIIFR